MDSVELIAVRDVLRHAIREDIGGGDVTSRTTVPDDAVAVGRFTAKQELVVAGIPIAREVARLFDETLVFEPLSHDGERVGTSTCLATIRGPARSILTIERTALNFLQRLSGIATATRMFVDRVAGTKARIVDTRKTVPGLRLLDKYAVRCGGGMNHRTGLYDGVLIKNNHLEFHDSPASAVKASRQRVGHLVKIEVEVRSLDQLRSAIEGGADVILLDNMSPSEMNEAVRETGGRVPLEASGGVTLENVREYADTGVDYISVGVLTHSVKAVDIHLKVARE